MKKSVNRNILIRIYILVFLITVFNAASHAEPKPSLKVGGYPTAYTRLIAITDFKGYFKQSGIDVTIKKFPSGTSVLNAVIQGKVDIGTAKDSSQRCNKLGRKKGEDRSVDNRCCHA